MLLLSEFYEISFEISKCFTLSLTDGSSYEFSSIFFFIIDIQKFIHVHIEYSIKRK